jgi:hypothetical protein
MSNQMRSTALDAVPQRPLASRAKEGWALPYDRTRKSLTHEVLQKARALARSGRFSTISAVESELRDVEGFAAAQRWFKDPNFRAQIAKLCQHAKEATIGGEAKGQTGSAGLATQENLKLDAEEESRGGAKTQPGRGGSRGEAGERDRPESS